VEGLPKSVAGIEIEDRLNLGGSFVGKINEGAPARHRHQHRGGPLLYCQLNKVERVADNLNRVASIVRPLLSILDTLNFRGIGSKAHIKIA